MTAAQRIDGGLRQRSCLVEPPLPMLRPVQRHRHHQHLCRSIRQQLRDRLRQHGSKLLRGGMHSVVLQRMNCLAQPSIVSPKCHSPCERRRRNAARSAEVRLGDSLLDRRVQRVAASPARPCVADGYFSPAGIANWNGRKSRQRGAAKSTGGGKKCGTNCVQRTSEYPHNRAPTGCLR